MFYVNIYLRCLTSVEMRNEIFLGADKNRPNADQILFKIRWSYGFQNYFLYRLHRLRHNIEIDVFFVQNNLSSSFV